MSVDDEKPLDNPATALFDQGWFCAESVLGAVAEARGIDSALVPAIATGLCSGLARTGNTCGAVSGAVMAIGLACGRRTPGDRVDEAYGLSRQFMVDFAKRYGSTNCTELLGCHLGTPEGYQHFKDRQLGKRCRQYTGAAYDMALDLVE